MDSDQQQQKGLFTFYREQADFQDEIKFKKRQLKQAKLERIEDNQKKTLNYPSKSKGQLNAHKKINHSLSTNSQRNDTAERPTIDQKNKSIEAKDKLMSILRKYNVKESKRRDHLRVIMEMQEEPTLDQTQQLKIRLQKLLADEQNDYFKLVQSEKVTNQQTEQRQNFTKRKQDTQRLNPFQRLAIIPTNFTTELEQQKDNKLPLKKVPSPPKNLAYSLQVRKNDRVEVNLQLLGRYDAKRKQNPSNQPLKLNLPKIDARSNSQMLNKSKLKPIRLGEKNYVEPLHNESYRSKSSLSMFLDSIKMINENPPSRQLQNKIHSLFIENKQNTYKSQDVNQIEKQIKLMDIVKKMKFS